MYTVSHYQGYNEPTDNELLESYEGEAREIILAGFIEDGMFSDTVYVRDDIQEGDIELETKDYFSAFEIEQLKLIEKYASESFWDSLTIQSLAEALEVPTNERRVA